MDPREQKMIDDWGPIKSQTDDNLKQIAKDIYNGLIYTDRHSGSDTAMVFMVLMFMGPQPPKSPEYPNKKDSVENNRDNAIYDVLQRDADQKKYEEDRAWYEKEYDYYQEHQVKSIGLVYEYLDKRGPTAINGKPTFFSLRLLNHDDTKKMFEYYEQYKEIREKADNF